MFEPLPGGCSTVAPAEADRRAPQPRTELRVKLRSLASPAVAALLLLATGCPENTYPAGEKDAYPLTDLDVFKRDEHNKAEEMRKRLADPATKPEDRAGIITSLSDQAKKEKDELDSIEKTRPMMRLILARLFGSPEHPSNPTAATATVNIKPLFENKELKNVEEPGSPLETGRQLYKQHCMHCHGFYGFGDGPTANFLLPKPRDFRFGKVKFTSTDGGKRAVHDDLVRTIAQGIQGTMMPAFGPSDGLPQLGIFAGHAGPPGFDVDAVASYIYVLLMRGSVERQLAAKWADDGELNADNAQEAVNQMFAEWDDATKSVIKPPVKRPDDFNASAAKGKELFMAGAGCVKCHGKHGLGADSPKEDEAMPDQPNEFGLPSLPMNLTLGIYRGGRRPVDLYRRVYAGIKGTAMPGQHGNLTDEQIWNVVDYVYQLGMPKPEKAE